MSQWKLFLDHITDLEDALQRMVSLNHAAGYDDVALLATDAADALLMLSQAMVRRGDRVPVVDTGYRLIGSLG